MARIIIEMKLTFLTCKGLEVGGAVQLIWEHIEICFQYHWVSVDHLCRGSVAGIL